MSAPAAPDFPSVLELGAWLPQYEVRRQIQAGPDGALYLGSQPALDRIVVIEVLPEPGDAAVGALLDRLRLRGRLVHPGITAVFDFGRTPAGQFYLVSEHVEGVSLEFLIEQRQLKPKTAFPLALQVCEALQIVHDLPMPHGVLGPRTVMVTPENRVKLTGIGMAWTEAGELSWLEPFHGTLTGDMRALGDTLHWMFAKCAPGADGRLSRDLPPAFAGVFRRCLEPDSPRPFTRPADVAAALQDALRGEQGKSEYTTRTRMVISPGSKPAPSPASSPVPESGPASAQASASASPAAPAAAPAPAPAPRTFRPPMPVVRHHQPTFFQRVDTFVWKAFSTGLHMLISVISIGGLILLILFKDKITVEQDTFLPMATVEEMEADEKPIPATVLGGLPPAEMLSAPPVAVKPVTLPPPAAPAPVPETDPMADLRTQYLAAVQSAANQALESVKLDDLPYLQRELQLLQSGGDIPSVDEPDLPASLKALRQRYREVRAGQMPAAP